MAEVPQNLHKPNSLVGLKIGKSLYSRELIYHQTYAHDRPESDTVSLFSSHSAMIVKAFSTIKETSNKYSINPSF